MWYLEKDVTISAAHHLRDYEGKCADLHGHSWHITVYCKGDKLDNRGILIDFKYIKELVSVFDHNFFNAEAPFDKVNPTAENIAQYLCMQIPHCYKVMVQEEEGSRCEYVKD